MKEDLPSALPDPTSAETRPGDKIGPYRIERSLGMGGMGEVVLAYDQRLDRRVAIKRVRRDGESGERNRARFRREARAAAGLSHPVIVRIHDILEDGDSDAIVMEWVDGSTVAQRLQQGPLSLGESVRLARQIAEGLAEAHESGVVHRDLKAENVMVTASGDAKILDFGLAKNLSIEEGDVTLTRQGTILGTVRSMSPEQAGGREVDHRSDLFSFGVLLCEMLTGRSPFRGENSLDTLRRVQTVPAPFVRELRPDVPAELEQLIRQLLEKQPRRRPGSAAEVARRLAELGDLGSAEAPPLDLDRTDRFGAQETGSRRLLPQVTIDAENGGPGTDRPLSTQGRWRWAVAVLAVLAAVALGWVFVGRGLSDGRQPVRVVVLPADIATADALDPLTIVASGARLAALSTLTDLTGVVPIDSTQTGETAGTAVEIARRVAADEVLAISVEPVAGSARISLRRVAGESGEILWTETFDVSLRLQEARLVAEATASRLRRAYPDSVSRLGGTRLEAADDDFTEFVQVSQRLESGSASEKEEFPRLAAIIERSPRFLEALLTGARIGLALHSDLRDEKYLGQAEEWIRQARALAPDQPNVLRLELRAALARGDVERGRAAVAELSRLAPQSVEELAGRARLAEYEGDLEGAVEAMRGVVDRWPAWRNLYRLADLEYRRGNYPEARRLLEELLGRAPDNRWGIGKLAQLELLYGDLARAAQLAQRAIDISPHRSYFTNLGLARFLLGQYEEAKANYLEALVLDPGNATVRLNLAETYWALESRDEARVIYSEIADELEGRERAPTETMTLAQCQAYLGDARRAVELTLEMLREHPEHAEVAYQAAVVYALTGETASALVTVRKARQQGTQPRWFQIPAFDSLRTDPRFQSALLDS